MTVGFVNIAPNEITEFVAVIAVVSTIKNMAIATQKIRLVISVIGIKPKPPAPARNTQVYS